MYSGGFRDANERAPRRLWSKFPSASTEDVSVEPQRGQARGTSSSAVTRSASRERPLVEAREVGPCAKPLDGLGEALGERPARLPPELGTDLARVRHPDARVPAPVRHRRPVRLGLDAEHGSRDPDGLAERDLLAGADVVDGSPVRKLRR